MRNNQNLRVNFGIERRGTSAKHPATFKKKAQMEWVTKLLIAIVAASIILFLYWKWKTASVEGTGFIKNLINF